MKVLLFVLFAGYAVRCDDKNYYVVEMLESPFVRTQTKPFKVYWNVPTKQCKSKKILFENLYKKYGIIQNNNDAFMGEKVTILYDPGLFPALLKNETSGRFKFRNGGVPQEGDLNKHLKAFKDELDQSIPDEDFDGVGIIDFESWRPVYRQNFGVLRPYQDVSLEIVRKQHSWWPKAWLQAEAKRRFEEAARTFMQGTLAAAKQLRARARWGFYGFPYCFNMASNNMQESCAANVPQENDNISWLWRESTALYPSVYSSVELSTSQLTSLIRGRVQEAARFGRSILPYFWYQYRDAGFLSKVDLNAALNTLYKSNASGFIIWGSSNDVNTVAKCTNLLNYVEQVMGPAIAKYTKSRRLQDETGDNSNETTTDSNELSIENDTTNVSNVATTSPISNSTNRIKDLDPEYHWTPPENYTQVIKDHVEEEINKKLTNYTETGNSSVLDNNVLIDLILNSLLNTSVSSSNNKTAVSNVEISTSKIVNNETASGAQLSSTTTEESISIISYTDIYGDKKLEELNVTSSTESEKSFEATTYYDGSYNYMTKASSNIYDTTSISPDNFTNTIDDTSKSKNIKKIFYQDGIEGFFDTTTKIPLSTEPTESNNIKPEVTSSTAVLGDHTTESQYYSTETIAKVFVTKIEPIETTTKSLYDKYNMQETTQINEAETFKTTASIKIKDKIAKNYSSSTESDRNIDVTTELSISTKSPNFEENNKSIHQNSNESTKNDDQPSTKEPKFKERVDRTEKPDSRNIDNSSTKAPDIIEIIDTEVTKETQFEDTSLVTTTTSPEQVSGSAQRIIKSQTLYCIVFYIYSVSKCMCSFFRQCS